MEIGGVGAMGASLGGLSSGAAPPVGGAGSVAGPGQPGLEGLTPQMQALVDLLGGFTSAQILIALMASRGKKGDDEDPMAVLLGMSLASQLQQMTQDLAKSFAANPDLTSSGCGSTVGTQLNVLA